MKPSLESQIRDLAATIHPDPMGAERVINRARVLRRRRRRVRNAGLAMGIACTIAIAFAIATEVPSSPSPTISDADAAELAAYCQDRLTPTNLDSPSNAEGSAQVTLNQGISAALERNAEDAVLCSLSADGTRHKVIRIPVAGAPADGTSPDDLILKDFVVDGRRFYLVAGNTSDLADEPGSETDGIETDPSAVTLYATPGAIAANTLARNGSYWLLLAEAADGKLGPRQAITVGLLSEDGQRYEVDVVQEDFDTWTQPDRRWAWPKSGS